MTGRCPALAALPRTLSMPFINEMQRRPASARFLVTEVNSTVELPSEPDPGSAGSSSCVRHVSAPICVRRTSVVLADSSNFLCGTLCVRSILGPCRPPEERTRGRTKTPLFFNRLTAGVKRPLKADFRPPLRPADCTQSPQPLMGCFWPSPPAALCRRQPNGARRRPSSLMPWVLRPHFPA